MTVHIILAILGLVFGVIGTLGFVVTICLCCVLLRTKKELRLLKCQVERGSAGKSYVDPNTVLLSQHPQPSPQSTTPPLSGNRQPEPLVMVDVSKAYSSVNQLSLLPDNVRTAMNLEGDTVPTDQETLLLEKYQKDRADYELQQLQKMNELKANREGVPQASISVAKREVSSTSHTKRESVPEASVNFETGAGYEDVELLSGKVHAAEVAVSGDQGENDPYASPADAVPRMLETVGGAKKPPKKLCISKGVLTVGQDYTPVFNTLPKGHVEKFPSAQGRTTRAFSDSTSPKTVTTAYENSPWPSPSKDGSEQVGVAADDIGDRQDRNRHSKRGRAKEVVEFDPHKQRKFRVTSDVKNPDRTDGGGSLESSQGEDTRPFSIHTDDQVQLSYALVNMEDKKRYRLETTAIKSEGSGTPQHYRVPIASS